MKNEKKSFQCANEVPSTLLVTILLGMFYITESKVRQNKLIFYRKRVWQRLHAKGLEKLQRSGALKRLKRRATMKNEKKSFQCANEVPSKITFT